MFGQMHRCGAHTQRTSRFTRRETLHDVQVIHLVMRRVHALLHATERHSPSQIASSATPFGSATRSTVAVHAVSSLAPRPSPRPSPIGWERVPGGRVGATCCLFRN